MTGEDKQSAKVQVIKNRNSHRDNIYKEVKHEEYE